MLYREFKTEDLAKSFLVKHLQRYFRMLPECRLRHIDSGNILRVDFIARPLKGIEFPHNLFAIEVKKNFRGDKKEYRKHLWQALDYTHCKIVDPRAKRVNGERIKFSYVFPGGHDEDGRSVFACNRLIGLGNVGQIVFEEWYGNIIPNTAFYLSGSRQWCAKWGKSGAAKKHSKIGSGVVRKNDA